MSSHSFGFYWSAFFGLIVARYFLIAGSIYGVLYLVMAHRVAAYSLRRSPPQQNLIRQNITLSLVSAIIFALGAAIVMIAYDQGLTQIYADSHPYGAWYSIVSLLLVLILQDTYFYFLHRAFHHPRLFKWVHRGHHASGDPTPWASFAFDPPEAVLQALFFVLIVFILPLHFIILLAVLLTMTIWAVWNHLGYEFLPPAFAQHWLGKWLIGPTHHALHHRKYQVHYGLYFTTWDRLLGTHDPEYEQRFDAALKN